MLLYTFDKCGQRPPEIAPGCARFAYIQVAADMPGRTSQTHMYHEPEKSGLHSGFNRRKPNLPRTICQTMNPLREKEPKMFFLDFGRWTKSGGHCPTVLHVMVELLVVAMLEQEKAECMAEIQLQNADDAMLSKCYRRMSFLKNATKGWTAQSKRPPISRYPSMGLSRCRHSSFESYLKASEIEIEIRCVVGPWIDSVDIESRLCGRRRRRP